MKSHIMYIGVIDKNKKIHFIKLEPGVNVITGKSSTGKSALLEIFDYCMGSSDYTVPVGVITESTDLFFTIIKVNESILVLARKPSSSRVFLREELDKNYFENDIKIDKLYFNDDEFLTLKDFLSKIKRYFGITVTDIDEDLQNRLWSKKSATPSVRSFTSYMLQHQNLIANKHAVFYRFEQKEKREQAIQHLKIFLGFVNQQYYTKSQKLNELERELNKAEKLNLRNSELKSSRKIDLDLAIKLYLAISGQNLNINIDEAVSNPSSALEFINRQKIITKEDQNEFVKLKIDLENNKRKLLAESRDLQVKIKEIQSSIDFANNYTNTIHNIATPESANISVSTCPFCKTENHEAETQANQLTEAIEWLNNELSHSSFRLESFEEEKSKLESKLKEIELMIRIINTKLSNLEKQTKELENYKTQYEIAVQAKGRIVNILLELINYKSKKEAANIVELKRVISSLKSDLSRNFKIKENMERTENRINELLSIYGGYLNFEKTYNPINLNFSVETFDLWHTPQGTKNQKVFLRSMGSGANWLSCHIALFLSLHHYFCELDNQCSIPSILFLDQPSQVYFPSILDNKDTFSAEDIALKDISRDVDRPIDEDVKAVTNLYEQLVKFCREVKNQTNIMPQIIITDHADKLQFNKEITNEVTFESLVRKRWREINSGFIQ